MRDMATPLVIHHLPEAGSTQTVARELANAGAALPALVVVDRQTRGRGRTGRTWEAAPRALACSLAVAPDLPAERRSIIPLIAGLAARAALAEVAGVTVSLKWPNDLVTSAGKVGGILVEGFDDLVVVGTGINLWWPDPPDGFAAAMPQDPGANLARQIAPRLAELLLDALDGAGDGWDRDAYAAACATLGQQITWQPNGSGTAVEIAPDGGLVVDTGEGRQTIHSGEVRTIRAATLVTDHDEGQQQ